MTTIVLFFLVGCAAKSGGESAPVTGGDAFEVVNGSPCTARISAHDAHGRLLTQMKFPDMPPGRTERFRVPHPDVTLTVVGIDALGNACSPAQTRNIKITKLQ